MAALAVADARQLLDNGEIALALSMEALRGFLDAVNWQTISKGDPDAWLYFYEDFLEVYDNDLRKSTGSYYTPPKVVGAMVRLVDDVLRSRFQQPSGLASAAVTLADPAVAVMGQDERARKIREYVAKTCRAVRQREADDVRKLLADAKKEADDA